MNILALDLGTKCGWSTPDHSGVWNLAPSKFDSAGERYREFRNKLKILSNNYLIEFVVFEEVRAHMAVDAAHVYGGLVAILQTFCLDNQIEYKGVPVGTIKKFATGKGNAKKPDMILAATRLYPSINIIDDNHADSLCLLHWAKTNLTY